MTKDNYFEFKKWAVPLKEPTEFLEDLADDDIEKIKLENQVLRDQIKNIEAENFSLKEKNEKLKEKQKSVRELWE